MRVDTTSLFVPASPHEVFLAFSEPGAMECWLPPDTMTGTMLHFDFRSGGSYRMRLTYADTTQAEGKTTGDSDEVAVRLTRIEEDRTIEQKVVFDSDDPAFSGTMRMIWSFQPESDGTRVAIMAKNVPLGIHPEDHVAGMNSSLVKLARFVVYRNSNMSGV